MAGADNNRAKKKKSSDAPGAPAWMVTYSDLVTLLLTFFVLLLSMAQMDDIKFLKVANSLRSAFGVMGTLDTINMTQTIVETGVVKDDLVQRVYKKIKTQLNRLTLNKDITLVKDRGAVILRINDAILFDVGQSEIKPEALEVLSKVAELVRPMPLQLRIQGHTDDAPFANMEMDNWDLSMRRAISVLKLFAKNKLFPLERMSAVGFGSQRPLVPNDSAENRALNRRVEFVLESSGSYTEELPFLIDARDDLPF